MIYFDLDGVLRHLTYPIFGRDLRFWSEPMPNGGDFLKHINSNLNILLDAPPTPFYSAVKDLKEVHILTNQPDAWKPNTLKWIDKYFADVPRRVVQFVTPEQKLNILKRGGLLVEDYPHFEDYSRIVLIDKPYNQNVHKKTKPFKTIKEPQELSDFLTHYYSKN